MPPPPELPTWQILPAAGGHFRWASAAGVPDPASHPGDALQTLAPRRDNLGPSRLPSMSDLLLQVRPDYRREDTPTFRTGSGRAVTLSESSIRKASSILESGITADQGPPPSLEGSGGDGFVPMFRTGLGKSVTVRQSSIRKAAAVLEGEVAGKGQKVLDGSGEDGCFPVFRTGPGKSVFVRQSSIRKAAAVLEGGKGPLPISEGSGEDGCFPVFHTGSGNSVAVRQSSIRKAAAVLEGEAAEEVLGSCNEDGCIPMFRTGSGKSVAVRQSSIRKAAAVLEEEGTEKGPPQITEGSGEDGCFPMFRTGSGKSVAVSELSIRKAAAVLEGEATEKGHLPVAEGRGEDGCFPVFRTGSGKSVAVRQSSMRKAAAVLEGDGTEKGPLSIPEGSGEDGGFSMFRNGSGKSVEVSQSSIRKAAAVLEVSAEKAHLPVFEASGEDRCVPMFRTGSGKSVAVRQSSIRKAAAVLEGEAVVDASLPVLESSGEDGCFPMFRTGLGKSVAVRQSSIRKAAAVLEGEATDKGNVPVLDGSISNGLFQMFRTGSGKSVTVTESSMRKAAAVLDGEGREVMVKARWNGVHGTAGVSGVDLFDIQSGTENSSASSGGFYSSSNHSFRSSNQNSLVSELHEADSAQPQIKFNTAGGRSISISNDAIQRAKNLLGGSELGVPFTDLEAQRPLLSFPKDTKIDDTSWNKENLSFGCQNARSKHGSRVPSHVGSLLKPKHLSSSCADRLRMIPEHKPVGGPLVEISHNIGAEYVDTYQLTGEKKRVARRSSVPPFKKPRISRFKAPLNNNIAVFATGSSMLSIPENRCCRKRVSTHYPFTRKKKSMKGFFGGPPIQHDLLGNLPNHVKHMNTNNAEQYKFPDASGCDGIGAEAFQNMLLQAGASLLHATKEWVANHYKWIVWKLASYERSYPAQASGKYLTVPNVLEELKYRYEREFNCGHRSALKRILDGDASPASMMVLCISATRANSKQNFGEMDDRTDLFKDSKKQNISSPVESNYAANIQLTDGWYSLDAFLDASLSKQLAEGKLFIGQKLRICGAGLCGWAGPISPLEASKTVSLLMHINGTYRAHWAASLGFCKDPGAPLAFRCIAGSGGKVSRTLVGVTRIYPILYKERFSDGGSIVRSDMMEKKALQLYNERRSNIAEDIRSEQQGAFVNDNDNEEGAKIFKILENAAEPEMIMADMSAEQLISFSTFQAKQEATRHSDMQKKVEKALVDAGLNSREISPFMRVRVVGLTSKDSCRKGRPREGLITIWNPTEEQKVGLVEGKAYLVSGLTPLNFCADTLYLQTRGSSTVWKLLPSSETEKFVPFFSPRKSVLLSNLGEVPLASEFDLAAVIVYVGDVYISGRQKKQWIFMTDGSGCGLKLKVEEPDDCLLAISFCSPVIDNDSSPVVNKSLSGTTVGFFNLVKRARDQVNNLWVSEATENSTYTVCHKLPYGSHLKEAADFTQKWAKSSSLVIEMLRERALFIIGGDGD